MTKTIVWMDLEKAKLFNMDEGKLSTKHLHAHDPNHHTHVKSQDEKDSPRFYKEIYGQIQNKTKILILGPGVAKKHFETYVSEHHPAFQKNIVALVTVDHPTDPQIEEYFKLLI